MYLTKKLFWIYLKNLDLGTKKCKKQFYVDRCQQFRTHWEEKNGEKEEKGDILLLLHKNFL